MCFLVPKMNSDSLGASQLANMKQVAACNIQISRGSSEPTWQEPLPVSVNDHHCTAVWVEKQISFDWTQNLAHSKKSPLAFTFSTNNMMFREEKHFHMCCQTGWQNIKKKSYQQLTELTSSWQVTGIYFPQWWLTVLIFQRAAAVHQSQQQMAIMHLSH